MTSLSYPKSSNKFSAFMPSMSLLACVQCATVPDVISTRICIPCASTAKCSLCRLVSGLGRSTTMASRTASNCDTSCRLAPVTTSDNATPRPSTSKWRLLPFFPPIRRIGTDALLSHWRLYHCTVNTLPSPGNAFKLVVLSETQFAQCLKDPCLLPLQEAGVDCAGTAVALGGQGLSLAACVQYKHDAFKY